MSGNNLCIHGAILKEKTPKLSLLPLLIYCWTNKSVSVIFFFSMELACSNCVTVYHEAVSLVINNTLIKEY